MNKSEESQTHAAPCPSVCVCQKERTPQRPFASHTPPPAAALLPIPMPIRIPIRAYPNLKFSIPLCIPLGPGPPRFQLCPLAASMLLSPFSEGNCDWEQGTGTGTGARLVCRRQTPPAPQAAPIYPSHIYNSLSVVVSKAATTTHHTHTHIATRMRV